MTKPTKPTVPPAPSRANPGPVFSQTADTFAAFQAPFADYLDAVAGYVDDRADEALVAAGHFDIAAFAELATKFVTASRGAGQQIIADGDVVLWRGAGAAYRCNTASGVLDYTGSGGTRFDLISNPAEPQHYGSAGSAATDAPAFSLLFANHKNIRLPWRLAEYNIGAEELVILDDMHVVSNGATIIHTNDTKIMFHANDVDDWSWTGKTTLVGLLTASADTGEGGLKITNGNRYRVSGVTARLFNGRGFHLTGTNPGAYRGDRGQFTDCGAYECFVGRQLDAGAGAEFTSWSNWNASGNITGDIMGAGNTTTSGGSIVDNNVGVKLIAGSNHGHGIYIGTQINHNNSSNLEAVGVLNGYTFSGCHFYGNGSSTGSIWLNGCKGIQIRGGIIDCWIYNDSGTGSGANFITDNFLPGDYGVSILSNNSALGQLYLSGNFDRDGISDINDPATVYVEATRASSTQNLSAGATTLDFNNEVFDNRGAFASGIFTAPVDGIYQIEAVLTVTAAGALANSYVAIVHNNTTDYGYIPIVALSGTLGIGAGSITVTLAAGNTLRLKSTITGTAPVLAQTQSRICIKQVS